MSGEQQLAADTVPPSGETSTTTRPVRDVVDYELLFDCVHCGLCLEACPTYVLTRAEMDSPRGRIYLMKALAEGQVELDDDAVRHLDLCLECRGCETACPSGVHYGRLIEKARVYINRNYQRSFVERVRNRIINAIFPYPQRFRLLVAPLKLIERLRLRSLAARLAPGALREWIELLPPLNSRRAARASRASADAAIAEASRNGGPVAVVHHGCVAQVLSDAENWNSERMLAAAGYRVARLEQTVCCGALDLHNGNIERALEFARANVREFKKSGAQSIVSAASGCAAAIAAYGELLKDDLAIANDGREISSKVADLSSLILARKLARRKADNIIATGADYVVLSNPGCEFQIEAELRRRDARTKVLHLADFLAQALKAESQA